MKRVVNAADDIMAKVVAGFEEQLDIELYNEKYEVKCSGQFPDVKIEVICKDAEPHMMPTIQLTLNEFEPDMFEVIPTLTFPTLTVSDGDYADTIHYWISRWEQLGKRITKLNKLEFNLESALEAEE